MLPLNSGALWGQTLTDLNQSANAGTPLRTAYQSKMAEREMAAKEADVQGSNRYRIAQSQKIGQELADNQLDQQKMMAAYQKVADLQPTDFTDTKQLVQYHHALATAMIEEGVSPTTVQKLGLAQSGAAMQQHPAGQMGAEQQNLQARTELTQAQTGQAKAVTDFYGATKAAPTPDKVSMQKWFNVVDQADPGKFWGMMSKFDDQTKQQWSAELARYENEFWQQAQQAGIAASADLVAQKAVQKFNSLHADIQLPLPPVQGAGATPNAATSQAGGPAPVGADMFEPARK